jgi:HAD superfamily hydrolase (TIGR01490 family)
MKLAFFDLDHTLIPFDSGMAWTRFLAKRGVLPAGAPDTYLAYCHQYVAGTLDIRAMHRATVKPLSTVAREQVDQWAREFQVEVAAQVPAAMRALVQRHQDDGDLCALVTATTRFIAEPFARIFGVPHVVSTEPEVAEGRYTGEIAGDPCYREHKLAHARAWLCTLPPAGRTGLDAFERSWFYTDSIGDLALLEAVSDPVAVRPDEALRAHAKRAGWPILDEGGA